nr:hypothetical protein [Tanacetum cinerariifolium]
TSLIELEYHLEEVYKATTDQFDWVNPEGRYYPHNLLQPLPLIPDNRGRHVIPFAHAINNDLEYLWGGASSRKYTTFVTKTKAVDYRNIKWIKDLFYGFAVNRESALDVYSKRRIIAIMDLKIVKWHSYKHLDWITVRREDDKLYKFKEAWKDSLKEDCMRETSGCCKGPYDSSYAASIFIELVDQKLNSFSAKSFGEDVRQLILLIDKINSTFVITVHWNLVESKAIVAIEESFRYHRHRLTVPRSDGTLNDVRNALNDRLKGIRMQYLPQVIWRKGDKDRAAAMIQSIDKMLKTRRIMRSLERFVGGRLYEGDFGMLQRTI